jgi:RNA polymerase-binding transcription factor DksA
VDDATARSHLADEQRRLEGLRAALGDGHPDGRPGDSGPTEAPSVDQRPAGGNGDAFEREKEFSVLDQVAAELAEVDRALERLDAGTYGRCDACGEPIADERLAAQPAARLCVEHQVEADV